jgi:hypothetical protein
VSISTLPKSFAKSLKGMQGYEICLGFNIYIFPYIGVQIRARPKQHNSFPAHFLSIGQSEDNYKEEQVAKFLYSKWTARIVEVRRRARDNRAASGN